MSENPTKQNQKVLTQQIFHPSLFVKQRSSSLNPGHSNQTNEPDFTLSQNENNSPLDETTEENSPQYPAPPPWQSVLPPRHNKKRKMADSPPQAEGTTTRNRFSGLTLDLEDDTNSSKTLKPSKPPPIVLSGIEDVNELYKLLESVTKKEEFKLKLINKFVLHVLVNSAEEYKKVITVIREKGIIGHTFTPKETKCYRFVIKDLHHSTPHETIIEAVEATNNKVKGEIINARYGPDKIPTSTFFVNIEPSINNPAVKDIKYIHHQKVKIEDPYKSKSIVQCQRCQQYGHSKNNCMRPFRCVKCGEGHKSSACKKIDRTSPAKCALCSCDHPANYKGCEIYKEIMNRRNKTYFARDRPAQTTTAPINPPTIFNPTTTNLSSKDHSSTHTRTYADVAHGSKAEHSPHPNSLLQDILLKQTEKMDLLIQQIGALLGLITTLVSKLAK